MPGARHLTVVLFAAIWIVSACVNVAPSAQTSLPVAPATGSGAEPTAESPTVEPPIVEPTEPPAPEPTATATAEPEPEPQPNLIILELEVEEEPVFVGSASTLTITVANVGLVDAEPFRVQVVAAGAGQPDAFLDTQGFTDGLAAGDSGTTTATLSPIVAGDLTITASADPSDQISEEVESDNEKLLEITVQSVVNLAVPVDGFTVTPHPDAPGGYLFYFTYVNTGPSTLVATVPFEFFAYTDAGVYVEWGSHNLDLDLAPNAPQTIVVSYLVDPGTYRAYVLADPDNTLEEADEGDNEAYYDFTAP